MRYLVSIKMIYRASVRLLQIVDFSLQAVCCFCIARHVCTSWIFPQLLTQMLSACGNVNINDDLVLINCSPHLGNFLDLLDDVDGDDGDHQLDGGQGGQHRHPDDLVSLKPVQNLFLARALLHPPGGVLIVLPENIEFQLFETKHGSFPFSLS